MVNDFFKRLGLVIYHFIKFGQKGDNPVNIHPAVTKETAGVAAGEGIQVFPQRRRGSEFLKFPALLFSEDSHTFL
jgi:hypothetical protein